MLADLEIVGVAFGMSLLSYIGAEILRYSYVLPVMVAIFDSQLSAMSESVQNSLAVLLDPENVGVAFGISLLSCIEAEILRKQ